MRSRRLSASDFSGHGGRLLRAVAFEYGKKKPIRILKDRPNKTRTRMGQRKTSPADMPGTFAFCRCRTGCAKPCFTPVKACGTWKTVGGHPESAGARGAVRRAGGRGGPGGGPGCPWGRGSWGVPMVGRYGGMGYGGGPGGGYVGLGGTVPSKRVPRVICYSMDSIWL
jgi:hypothetical protein